MWILATEKKMVLILQPNLLLIRLSDEMKSRKTSLLPENQHSLRKDNTAPSSKVLLLSSLSTLELYGWNFSLPVAEI